MGSWVRTGLDAAGIGVIKTLLNASLCRYTGASTGPVLTVSDRIHCPSPEQIPMAIIGSLGTVIWFMWLVPLIVRKSLDSEPILNLYDFHAAVVLVQAKLFLGVATAAFSRTWPCVVLTT